MTTASDVLQVKFTGVHRAKTKTIAIILLLDFLFTAIVNLRMLMNVVHKLGDLSLNKIFGE